MDFFADCRSLNIGSNIARGSLPAKQESTGDLPEEVEDRKPSAHDWTFPLERNSSNIASTTTRGSVPATQKSIRHPLEEVEDRKPSAQDWTFSLLKTSPIVSAPAAKVMVKRKKRQNWSKVEDELLRSLVGGLDPMELKWPWIADRINKTFQSSRTGKQCRERWLNHLRPDIKKGNWTPNEEFMIEYFHNTFGPKWSTMSKLMKNRTDNDIKNKWNSMKRIEKAAGKRKGAPTRRTACAKRKPQRVGSHDTTTPQQKPSDNMQLFTAKKSSDLKYSSDALILPTVTDGGSAENSPVPTKMYWNYEV